MLSGDTPVLEHYEQDSAGWLAIHTRYQHESLAARSLAYKGFEVFLPVIHRAFAGGAIGPRNFPRPCFPATYSCAGNLCSKSKS